MNDRATAGIKTRNVRTNSEPVVTMDELAVVEPAPDGPARIVNMLGLYEEVVPVEFELGPAELIGEGNNPGKTINISPINTPNVKLSPTLPLP